MSAASSRRSFLAVLSGAIAAPAAALSATIIPEPLAEELPARPGFLDDGRRWLHHRVTGNELAPDLFDGDVATIDTEDRLPSPPGYYLVEISAGIVAFRLIEVVPNRWPLMARVVGGGIEERMPVETIAIVGRVVGRWRPVARLERGVQ